MGDAYTEFGLLLASVWDSEHGLTLVHRIAATDSSGAELLYAADRSGGRHVLAPIAEDYAFTPIKGAAVELIDWRHPQTGQRYLDLVCRVDALAPVFYRLADSIAERVLDKNEPCHAAILSALDDWQRLLRPATKLSEEVLRGLFGELAVLRMLAKRNPIYAVDAWVGPDRLPHDFMTSNGDVEVKSSKREGLDAEISSLGQLDEIGGAPLCLVRLNVDYAPNGQSIGDAINELVDLGCLRARLTDRLQTAGFQLGITDDDAKFIVTEPVMAWRVGEDFPGLRSYDIPESRRGAVTHIKYSLDLLNAPGLLTLEELEAHLDRMMTP